MSERLSEEVVEVLNKKFEDTPRVEQIQDVVENVLINNELGDVAKGYILYRARRTKTRELKRLLGVSDDLKLGINAIRVMEKRYLLKDDKGHVIETPKDCFIRVARAVSKIEDNYGGDPEQAFNEFFEVMSHQLFLPNSPTLMNAGTGLGQLSACFVLPINDSLESIFNTLKEAALIHQSGGGTGFSFSELRPYGDIVKSTGGIASGPVSFMRIYDTATDVMKKGGKRRGANMAVLDVNHPDIMKFMDSKLEGGFSNFNISVSVTKDFMKKVKKGGDYELINPRTGKSVNTLNAKKVFDKIVRNAWECGDPGLVFIDEVNKHNPTPEVDDIKSVNPCGEQPLLPNESCNLGSINLSRMEANSEVDWGRLKRVISIAVHFLDNVIDANKYTSPIIKKMTLNNRKIGLGVMGFADLLVKLGIPYNSKKALRLAGEIIKFIKDEAINESVRLAEQRGSFPNFDKSKWKGFDKMRNATLLTIAPTGTISIVAECSSGIEPLFAVSFIRRVLEGNTLLEVNELFEKEAVRQDFYSEELMQEIARTGSVQGIKKVPASVRRIFVTAFDIKPEWHVRMQSAFQKYVDNAVSKTINFSKKAEISDVRKAYLMAYKLRCKGITVYRYGSKPEQVLYFSREGEQVSASSEYSGGCPVPGCD